MTNMCDNKKHKLVSEWGLFMKSIKVPFIPRGTEDFAKMRRKSLDGTPSTIADKTGFLPKLLGSGDEVIIFTRPIRFMKSSTLSVLDRFLSVKNAESNKPLFDGLEISKDNYAEFRSIYQGKFPVIHLTFKNIRRGISTWPEAKRDFERLMANAYSMYKHILPSLDESEQAHYLSIMRRKAKDGDLENSLADMVNYLSEYYNKKVIILIDEYDTPLYRAHIKTKKEERVLDDSYFQSMVNFLGDFLSVALKGHPNVEKSFITGVLRTSFTNLVSSLNNAAVYSVLSPEFAELFGLTETEVEGFVNQIEGVEELDRKKIRAELRRWYNGYYISNNSVRMYNPWSVARFFGRLPIDRRLAASAYWLKTGDSLALSEYLDPRFERIKPQLTELMLGNKIQVEIDENTRMMDLDDTSNDSAFWGILLNAGYLSASIAEQNQEDIFTCEVAIPNYEVRGAYARLINRYHKNVLFAGTHVFDEYELMMAALQTGNIEEFATRLQIYMDEAVSFHDIPKQEKGSGKTREQVYHAFMLGVLVGLHSKYYKLSSNCESGYGRYDIVLAPEKRKHGLIFEFKAADRPDKLLTEAKNALMQIKEKRYSAGLEAAGVESGIHIGMSFYGKRFEVVYSRESYSAVLV